MADQIISRLLLGLDTREFRNGIRQADRELKDWSKGIGKIGEMLGAAFAVSVIADFTMEAVKLGDQLDAATKGFERFGNAADLDRLRKSTQGMVSDVKLLQQAVSAGNFGIPVKELGNLFEFAQKRAKETGQEVDYLTQSIVTGIGRKSPLILDNLGISASMLRDKLHGVTVESASIAMVTKAVGEIAEEQLKLMGKTVDDATTSSQRLVATWENFTASAGQTLGPVVNLILKITTAIFNAAGAMTGLKEETKLANGEVSGFGIWGIEMNKVTQETEKATREILNLGTAMRGIWNTFNTVGYTTLAGMKARLAELQKEFENADVAGVRFANIRFEIKKLEEQIRNLTNPVAGMMPKVENINLVSKGFKEVGDSVNGMTIEIKKAAPSINDLNTKFRDLAKEQKIVNELGSTLGRVLQESFSSALTNGEGFFKTFIRGLKQMVAQILATAAAAAALAIALMALGIPGVGTNFGQTFKGLYKAMGGTGADFMNFGTSAAAGGGGAALGGGRTILRGNDLFISNSRTNFEISRIGG
jgi:hypothetical protein